MTEQLYRSNAYMRDCTARVLAVNERGGIVLDRTVFYAAAGGQPGDKGAMEIEGALGVALVDSSSGMALGTAGSPMDIDLDVAAAGNSNVVQAKMRTMADLGLQQSIEDILITLDKQYHIIRPLARQEGFFLYLVLDRARANLAMARFRLASLEKDLKI